MNIRQLEYFLSVAAHRSMTVAARTLGISQPTLTKTIHALETELGVPLFERMPRGVNLTQYGVSLLKHAQAIHVQFGDAKREIDSLSGGRYGTVMIGAGPAWLRRHLPQAVARATSKNPSIKVSVEGGYDDALMGALRRGEIDMVLADSRQKNRRAISICACSPRTGCASVAARTTNLPDARISGCGTCSIAPGPCLRIRRGLSAPASSFHISRSAAA